MTNHQPEHLERSKRDLIALTEKVAFDQPVDSPKEAMEDLLRMMEDVAAATRNLCSDIGREIDQHNSSIGAESEVKEQLNEALEFISINIRGDIEATTPDTDSDRAYDSMVGDQLMQAAE